MEKTENEVEFNYNMPPTQYLGSKSKLLHWILSNTPRKASMFDAFSGSNIVAYTFKKNGWQVATNDYLNFSYQTALGTIENNQTKLNEKDIQKLLVENPKHDNFVEKHYSDLLYTQEECHFLDNLHANIESFDDKYKRALALAAICRTCIQKMPMGKFRSNLLQYRKTGSVHYRPKFAKDIKETFLKFLNGYNESVFDNGKQNMAYCGDTLDIIKKIDTDVAYFDPPYCGSGFHYESDYFFLELYAKHYNKELELTGKVKKYKAMQESRFEKRSEIESTFDSLFKNALHIPIWVISYNNRSSPDIKKMIELVSKYRQVNVIEMDYKYKFVGNSNLKEYLFVCD